MKNNFYNVKMTLNSQGKLQTELTEAFVYLASSSLRFSCKELSAFPSFKYWMQYIGNYTEVGKSEPDFMQQNDMQNNSS